MREPGHPLELALIVCHHDSARGPTMRGDPGVGLADRLTRRFERSSNLAVMFSQQLSIGAFESENTHRLTKRGQAVDRVVSRLAGCGCARRVAGR